MKILFLMFNALLFVGCTSVPYEELKLDTTSSIGLPAKGKTGIYVYRWQTGLYGAIIDIEFEIKGYPTLVTSHKVVAV